MVQIQIMLTLNLVLLNWLDGGHNVDTNDMVRIPSKDSGTICAPCQTSTVRSLTRRRTILIRSKLLGSQGVHNDLGFQVPNLNALVGGGTEPVPVGGEDEGVDDLTSIKGVEALALVQVPEHGGAVLAT